MAALEVLALVENSPGAGQGVVRVPATGSSYAMPRKLAIAPEANDNALVVTGYSLTGANAQSGISFTGTWNTTGTPTAIFANITDTASNALSLFADFQIGGSRKFGIRKSGQTEIYGSYTDESNYSRGFMTFAANDLRIGVQSAGSGTADGVSFVTAATVRWKINSSGNFLAQVDASLDIGGAANRPRDIDASRDVYRPGGTQAIWRTSAAITSGAGAAAGTLLNAPAAGDPTCWIPINDNGTIRYIPAW